MTFAFRAGDFTTAERTAIQDAAAQWNSSSSNRLRGAQWSFAWTSDRNSPIYSDGNNDVFQLDFTDQALQDIGISSEVASIVTSGDIPLAFEITDYNRWTNCSIRERDIVIADVNYLLDLPSELDSGQYSLPQIMVHEFGHALGFDHERSTVNTMWGSIGEASDGYPTNGDVGGRISIDEHDHEALQSVKGASSTGYNFSVGSYLLRGNNMGEGWFYSSVPILVEAGTCMATRIDAGLGPVRFVAHSTQTESWIRADWYLVPTSSLSGASAPWSDCSSYSGATQYDALLLRLAPDGKSFPIQRDVCPPVGLDPNTYRVCVHVDSDDVFSNETDESDNVIVLEHPITVEAP